nr:hypothetical protein CFP56_25890 [Quercus suber]
MSEANKIYPTGQQQYVGFQQIGPSKDAQYLTHRMVIKQDMRKRPMMACLVLEPSVIKAGRASVVRNILKEDSRAAAPSLDECSLLQRSLT